MSAYDEIAHLDFVPGTTEQPPLRERAAAAYEHVAAVHRHELLAFAAHKISGVLGEWSGQVDAMTIRNTQTGEGEVLVGIDGLQFRVNVVWSIPRTEESEATVTLGVKGKGGAWISVNTLAELGRHLEAGICAID